MQEQINFYKEVRNTIQFGDLYRLSNPFEDNDVSWMYVSKDKREVVVNLVRQHATVNRSFTNLKLRGLDKNSSYEIIGENLTLEGDILMNLGLNVPMFEGDFKSKTWRLIKKD